jgi:hypothetical protein
VIDVHSYSQTTIDVHSQDFYSLPSSLLKMSGTLALSVVALWLHPSAFSFYFGCLPRVPIVLVKLDLAHVKSLHLIENIDYGCIMASTL